MHSITVPGFPASWARCEKKPGSTVKHAKGSCHHTGRKNTASWRDSKTQFSSFPAKASPTKHLEAEPPAGAAGEDATAKPDPASWPEPPRGRVGSAVQRRHSLGPTALPSPVPGPGLTRPRCLRPSFTRPLPARPESFATGSSFAHGPGGVPRLAPTPPPGLKGSPHSAFQPLGSQAEVPGRKWERPRGFLPSGPFSSSVNGHLHSPLLLAGTLNRKVKWKPSQELEEGGRERRGHVWNGGAHGTVSGGPCARAGGRQAERGAPSCPCRRLVAPPHHARPR